MLLKLFIHCLILINLVNGQFIYGCPPSITRCSCSKSFGDSEYKVVVKCNDFNGFPLDFRYNLQALNGYEIDELIINNYKSPLSLLPDNVFQNTAIRKISLLNSGSLILLGSTTSFFDGLEDSLQTLRVENVPNLSPRELSKMATSLNSSTVFKNLYFFNNNKFQLSNFDAFGILTSLERICMRRNSQQNVEFIADLSNFTNLRFIDLSENGLTKFDITGYTPKLSTFYLFNNKIKTFSSSINIVNLPAIQLVDIRNNRLSCLCTDMRFIYENSTLALTFTGTCYTPDSTKGDSFGRTCVTSNGVIRRINDEMPIPELSYDQFLSE